LSRFGNAPLALLTLHHARDRSGERSGGVLSGRFQTPLTPPTGPRKARPDDRLRRGSSAFAEYDALDWVPAFAGTNGVVSAFHPEGAFEAVPVLRRITKTCCAAPGTRGRRARRRIFDRPAFKLRSPPRRRGSSPYAEYEALAWVPASAGTSGARGAWGCGADLDQGRRPPAVAAGGFGAADECGGGFL